MDPNQYVLLAFNVLLGVCSVLGAMWLRRMESDMKSMQDKHDEAERTAAQRELRLQEKLNDKVSKEDFREFLKENRDNFQGVFSRLETLADRIASPKVT